MVKSLYTYKPTMGDVVRWPNGVEMNYDEADGVIVVLHPDKATRIVVTGHREEGQPDHHMWLLGVAK